ENSTDRFNNAGIFRRIDGNYPTAVYTPTSNTGTISGYGEIQFLNGLNNTGIVAPGIAGLGQLKINSAQPLSANSVLNIEIFNGSGPGTGHDQLLRNGNTILSGTLNVIESGSIPAGDYTIISLTSGTISGSFTTINLPVGYSLQAFPTSVVLTKNRYYADTDNDGFGDINNYIAAATVLPPAGYVTDYSDCNDANTAINPAATELCNGIDDDCDGIIDNAIIEGTKLYLPFSGNGNDMSGFNHPGSIHNATLTAGHNGDANSAYQFNGTNGYIEVADHADLHPVNFTVSTWIYYTSVPGIIQAIIGKPLCGGYADSYGIWFQSGLLYFGWSNGPTSMDYHYFAAPAAGQWHHVALTFDDAADQAKVYIDNILAGTFPTSFTIAYDNTPLVVGNDYENCGLNYFFNGKIDDVALFDRALSATEINTLYTSSPVISLPVEFYADADGDGFGDPSTSITGTCGDAVPTGYVTNNSDCNDANPAINPAATEVCNGIDDNCDGQVDMVGGNTVCQVAAHLPGSGRCVGFPGSTSSYIYMLDRDNKNDFGSDQDFTVECWVNILSNNIPDQMIVQKGTSSSPYAIHYFGVGSTDPGKIVVGRSDGTNGASIISQASVGDHKWHHISFTRNGGTSGILSLYIDGILQGTSIDNSGSLPNTTELLAVGYLLDGVVDELRIWDTGMSQAQVRDRMCHKIISSDALYAHLTAYYNFDDFTGNAIDGSLTANHAVLFGTVGRPMSGAAIGNASSHDYFSSIKTASISHATGESFTATSVSGTAEGIQVYRVDEQPTSLNGALGIGVNDKYFGVFQIGGTSPQYSAVYNYNGNPMVNQANEFALRLQQRDDNADNSWIELNDIPDQNLNTISLTGNNAEYILGTICSSFPNVSFTGLASNYCLYSVTDSLIGFPEGGIFSGTGVINNNFSADLAGEGTYNISYTYTNASGCSNTASMQVTVTDCSTSIAVNLKLFLQGYYTGNGQMQQVLYNQGVSNSSGVNTDTIEVELHHPLTLALVESQKVLLGTNGIVSAVFIQPAGDYYVAIRHRNTIQTWSAQPLHFSVVSTLYDFSANANKAFGNNQVEVEPGVWAMFTGDLNQDDYVDGNDFPFYDSQSASAGLFDVTYTIADMNGDGYVDGNDFPVFDNNSSNSVAAILP
ncbi:MAG: LamG-like jellyroll fold domain-containing protein, partial [Ferruginibacter sp.]